MTTDLVARGVLAALALWIPFAAFVRETSSPAAWRGLEGYGALPFLLALAVAALLMALDILLNETMRRRLFPWIAERRDALYLAVAFLSILTPFSLSKAGALPLDGAYFYSIIFFGAMGLTWADARAKRGTR